VTVKYDANGVRQWEQVYAGPDDSNDQPRALAVDGSDNVYVAGWSGSGLDYDYVILKYDANGNLVWQENYDGPGGAADEPRALVVDSAGNIYVTGRSMGLNMRYDYATLKYVPDDIPGDSDLDWEARYNGSANQNDEASALTMDKDGNVYVTGQSMRSSTGLDYVTVKYDPDGNPVSGWPRSYNGLGSGADCAGAIVVDNSGNVYVTGESSGGYATYTDYATVKYAPDGQLLWQSRYDGPGHLHDRPYPDAPSSLAVDSNGNAYVTGESWGGGSYDYATVKYVSPTCVLTQDLLVNGVVDNEDIDAITYLWRQAAPSGYDFDGDGQVRVADVQAVTGHWGASCSAVGY
jgi:hypothetical protein